MDELSEEIIKPKIAKGQSILLSIYEPDNFYYRENIQLINYDDILKKEPASKKEIEFFELLKNVKTIKLSKKVISEYCLSEYIHFLPKVKLSSSVSNSDIIIIGQYKPVDSSEIPIITSDLNDTIILDINNSFEYIIPQTSIINSQIKFSFELEKQTFTRSIKIKLTED